MSSLSPSLLQAQPHSLSLCLTELSWAAATWCGRSELVSPPVNWVSPPFWPHGLEED